MRDLDRDLASSITADSGRHPLPSLDQFKQTLLAWGIGDETQVVVYDAAGGAIATRLWWMLGWIGHANVAVLDGGYQAWVSEGYVISDSSDEIDSANPKSLTVLAGHLADSIDTKELQSQLQQQHITLVDARDAKRFAGEHEPIDPVAGHIPGAVNWPFQHNLDDNGFFLDAERLKEQFESLIETGNDNEIILMCGSGVTACHNILAMKIAGIKPGRLYVGSWSEWIRDPDRPIGTGYG